MKRRRRAPWGDDATRLEVICVARARDCLYNSSELVSIHVHKHERTRIITALYAVYTIRGKRNRHIIVPPPPHSPRAFDRRKGFHLFSHAIMSGSNLRVVLRPENRTDTIRRTYYSIRDV